MSEQSNTFDTTEATPAGRKLRAWAAQQSPEVRAAADDLAQALWACAGNPPSRVLTDALIKRRAAFDALLGSLSDPVEIIGTRQSSALRGAG